MRVEILADFPEAQGATIDIEHNNKIEVCIDVGILGRLIPIPEGTTRIFVTSDPMEQYNQVILENPNSFSYVLTSSPQLLELPNSGLFVGCGSFVDPDPDIQKKFAVSMVLSSRSGLPGHQLRQDVYHRRSEINIPFDIYGSSGRPSTLSDLIPMAPWPDRKDKIRSMDCMFHIVIDSYNRRNMLSEKLTDCLITKTIPIYWGCTNIQDYYNLDGILVANNVDEIINIANSVTPELYGSLVDAFNDNYERALKCYKYEDILRDAILKVL
ncbi:MAG: hypothetical protein E4H21_11760 [Thermodesulfobacteriales bacterium]|nr:MAG: hypothetical protein E4H21_11760 [Thermodesulfobacteriales bacterium]